MEKYDAPKNRPDEPDATPRCDEGQFFFSLGEWEVQKRHLPCVAFSFLIRCRLRDLQMRNPLVFFFFKFRPDALGCFCICGTQAREGSVGTDMAKRMASRPSSQWVAQVKGCCCG